MDKVIALCPAKINLSLNIIGKKENMHLIKGINQSVSLYDEIGISTNSTEDIYIFCDNPDVPIDDINSCYRAAYIMQQTFNLACGFNISISKKIPLSSGLGGESTDAAGVFLGINELLDLHIPIETLKTLAIKVGSDVPFCLVGGTCLVESKGEVLTTIPAKGLGQIVIIKPNFEISTKEAFAKFDESCLGKYKDFNDFRFCYNDFEIIAPEQIQEIKEYLYNCGADYAMMSGSGSAVFGSFSDEDAALTAAVDAQKHFEECQVYGAKECSGIKVKKIQLN